jgi:hypothetical protein
MHGNLKLELSEGMERTFRAPVIKGGCSASGMPLGELLEGQERKVMEQWLELS